MSNHGPNFNKAEVEGEILARVYRFILSWPDAPSAPDGERREPDSRPIPDATQ